MKKWRIIWICFWVNPVFASEMPVDILKEKLVEVCTAYEKAFHSIQVEYTYTAPPISDEELQGLERGDFALYAGPQTNLLVAKPFDKKFMLVQELRLEDKHHGLREIHRTCAYNGRMFRELETNVANASLPPVGTIQEKPSEGIETILNNTPLGYTLFHRFTEFDGRSLLDLLKANDPNFVFSFSPAVTKVNNCDAIELICSIKWISGKTIKVFGIHFSLDHNYSPVRISKYNNNQVDFEYNVMKFMPLGNGFWFPIECVFGGREEGSGKISVVEVQINPPMEDNVFDLTFPPGTKVYDTIRGKQYTIKPTQEQLDSVLEAP